METSAPGVGVCVCCGAPAGALYRQYSPTVLKLTQCQRCGSVADKYLEYDPVIIMVDLVLLSKEAYRHVLYNTKFNVYWKLFIILLLMETYVIWSNEYVYKKNLDSVKPINYVYNVHSYINVFNNSYVLNKNSNENTMKQYSMWNINMRIKTRFLDIDEPFSFEKGLYVTFLCSFIATLIFMMISFVFSLFFGLTSLIRDKVEFILVCKALTLASTGNFLLLPALIWGSDHDRSMHLILVFGYTFLALINVHAVIYQCSRASSFMILSIAFVIKLSISSNLQFTGELLLENFLFLFKDYY